MHVLAFLDDRSVRTLAGEGHLNSLTANLDMFL